MSVVSSFFFVLRRGDLVRSFVGLKLLERENNRKGTTATTTTTVSNKIKKQNKKKQKQKDRWLDKSGIKRHATSSLSLITTHSARHFNCCWLFFLSIFCLYQKFYGFMTKSATHLSIQCLYILARILVELFFTVYTWPCIVHMYIRIHHTPLSSQL